MIKTSLMIVFAILGVGALYVYLTSGPPAGVETKGTGEMKEWISLATALVSLLGTVVTLYMKIVESRDKSKGG